MIKKYLLDHIYLLIIIISLLIFHRCEIWCEWALIRTQQEGDVKGEGTLSYMNEDIPLELPLAINGQYDSDGFSVEVQSNDMLLGRINMKNDILFMMVGEQEIIISESMEDFAIGDGVFGEDHAIYLESVNWYLDDLGIPKRLLARVYEGLYFFDQDLLSEESVPILEETELTIWLNESGKINAIECSTNIEKMSIYGKIYID